jgi:hypothetical protein
MLENLSQQPDDTLANRLYGNGSQEQADYFGYSHCPAQTIKG